MKKGKKFYILVFMVVSFFMIMPSVNAANCDALLTQEAADFISEIVGYIKIGVPILLIVMGSTDMVTIVMSGEQDAVKKATSRLTKRFIAAVAVFFIPTIITFLLSIDAVKNSLNLVDDPTCGIGVDE